MTSTIPLELSEPTRRVTRAWIAAFSSAWLAVWLGDITPIQLLLPLQMDQQSGASSNWVDNVVAFGVISGIGGVLAIVAYPLAGALSDRTTSRFGRRRPWIAVGALLFAAGLFMLGLQREVVGVAIWWGVLNVGFCVMTAALTAMIADQVPVDQRGTVSGWLAAPQAIGTLLGMAFIIILALSVFAGYAVLAGLMIVLTVPFLFFGETVLLREHRPPLTIRSIVDGMWIDVRVHRDFGWTLLGRLLVNLANGLGSTLMLYYLMYELKDANAEMDLIVLTAIYLVLFLVSALWMGPLSDRLGRRRIFVAVSATLQSASAVVLILVPTIPAAMVGAGLLGAGMGAFIAVDQALATQVLPDPRTRGKDLGIMNIASAVPQGVAPLLGAPIVAWMGGFTGLFVMTAICSLLGAFSVARIKSVR